MLQKTIFFDARLRRCSYASQRLYVGAMLNSDAAGRIPGEPAWVRGAVIPYDAATDAEVEQWMLEWYAHTPPLIAWYEANGIRVIEFLDFRTHNPGLRPQNEAKLVLPPPSPADLDDVPGTQMTIARGAPPSQNESGSAQKKRSETKTDRQTETVPAQPVPAGSLSSVSSDSSDSQLADDLSQTAAAIASEARDSDSRTFDAIVSLFRTGVPESVFRSAVETLQGRRRRQPPLTSEARYLVATVATMHFEKRERVR